MEKVLRVRVTGYAIDSNEEIYQIGGQVYRFIGNEEVDTAEEKMFKDWNHYSQKKFAPYELHFKFERLDMGKELNFVLAREFIEDGQGWEVLAKKIYQAVNGE